jgi:hypothetical protein
MMRRLDDEMMRRLDDEMMIRLDDEMINDEENLTVLRSSGLTVSELETLRYLFAYRNHYTDNLSIVETYLAENNFGEALVTLSNVYKQFELNEEQINELKSLEIYIYWLQQLEEKGGTIYKLPENEVEYLVDYVKTNTGRGTVFANNILCELYGTCIEAVSGERFSGSGDDEMMRRLDDEMINDEENLTVLQSSGLPVSIIPNPTTGELHVTCHSSLVTSIEVFDVYGKKLSSNHLITSSSNQTIDISHLAAGLYFVKIKTKVGEVVKKVVKQ